MDRKLGIVVISLGAWLLDNVTSTNLIFPSCAFGIETSGEKLNSITNNLKNMYEQYKKYDKKKDADNFLKAKKNIMDEIDSLMKSHSLPLESDKSDAARRFRTVIKIILNEMGEEDFLKNVLGQYYKGDVSGKATNVEMKNIVAQGEVSPEEYDRRENEFLEKFVKGINIDGLMDNMDEPIGMDRDKGLTDMVILDKYKESLRSYNKEKLKKGELNLTIYGVSSLPSEIGNLVALKKLELEGNRLRTLPPKIGNLVALIYLDLGRNNFQNLPREIGSLMALENLDISSNKLITLPDEIGKLSSLKILGLDNNKLTDLPSTIGSLKALKQMDLSYNQLTTLPQEIGNLMALETVNFGHNKLIALPDEIGKLSSLKLLNLDVNKLTDLPSTIGGLAALEQMDLHNNQLTTLPPEIGNLAALQDLSISNNQLQSLPKEIGNLRNLVLLDLSGNPILPRGENENTWGRAELRAHFGNRVVMDDPNQQPPMPANTTKEEVYEQLDSQSTRINREMLKAARVPEIPGEAIQDGSEFLDQFAKLVSKLNFDHENDPGYLSFELLAGDFANEGANNPDDNAQRIKKHLLNRLIGYFKTLYDMPLAQDEPGGWQMYEDKKPVLKKALAFIINTLTNLPDPEQGSILFTLFLDGMIHCPTGQSEGIDTVFLALLEGTVQRSSDLPAMVKNDMALKKNAFFKMAILSKAGQSTQNVHFISSYSNKLKDELGLSNVLGYEEKMGTFGKDPFSTNENNVLQVFYQLVTPQKLVGWFMDKVQTREDLELREKLGELEKKLISGKGTVNLGLQNRVNGLKAKLLDPEISAEEKPGLEMQLKQMEGMIARQKLQVQESDEVKQQRIRDIQVLKGKIKARTTFHPISTQIVTEYLLNNKIVDAQKEDWWQPYFSEDPMIDELAVLTRDGGMRILVNLGYVIVGGK